MPRGRSRKVVEFTSPQVEVPLDDKERAEKAVELAKLCETIDTARADKMAANAEAGKRLRALDKERRLLAESVRTGFKKIDAQLALEVDKKKAKNAGNGDVRA